MYIDVSLGHFAVQQKLTERCNSTVIKKVFFGLFRATPLAFGGSQATGQIGAIAASLHHSHSNEGSQPNL